MKDNKIVIIVIILVLIIGAFATFTNLEDSDSDNTYTKEEKNLNNNDETKDEDNNEEIDVDEDKDIPNKSENIDPEGDITTCSIIRELDTTIVKTYSKNNKVYLVRSEMVMAFGDPENPYEYSEQEKKLLEEGVKVNTLDVIFDNLKLTGDEEGISGDVEIKNNEMIISYGIDLSIASPDTIEKFGMGLFTDELLKRDIFTEFLKEYGLTCN